MSTSKQILQDLLELGVISSKIAGRAKYLQTQKRLKPKHKLEIENGIEFEQEGRGGARSKAFDFDSLEVGQSAWITNSIADYSEVKRLVENFCQNTGWEFELRAEAKSGVENNDTGAHMRGTRVWRIK